MEDEERTSSSTCSKHVLDSKRLQNMTILLEAINVTADQACNALINGTGLGLQQLEALVRMVPTKEEEAKLLEYKGDINELGSAEKFIKVLIVSIPLAFQRAEAMLYRETFEDEVAHLKNHASMIEEASKELRSSRLFLIFLGATLRIASRMNVGMIRGGALLPDALLQLLDVRGIDGKTTLFHCVVQKIIRAEGMRVYDNNNENNSTNQEENEEEYRAMGLEVVSGLSSELNHVKHAASLDLDVLGSSLSMLFDGMMKVKELMDHEKLQSRGGDDDDDEKNESFVSAMKRFIEYGERKLEELKGDKERVVLNLRETAVYFFGNLGEEEGNLLRIFVIVKEFLRMLDRACMELRSVTVVRRSSPYASI